MIGLMFEDPTVRITSVLELDRQYCISLELVFNSLYRPAHRRVQVGTKYPKKSEDEGDCQEYT